jgi:hypothetical protein
MAVRCMMAMCLPLSMLLRLCGFFVDVLPNNSREQKVANVWHELDSGFRNTRVKSRQVLLEARWNVFWESSGTAGHQRQPAAPITTCEHRTSHIEPKDHQQTPARFFTNQR